MRLLLITQDFPPDIGGIQTYSISHAAHLSGWCEWFGVLCPAKREAPAVDGQLSWPVFRIRSGNATLGVHLHRKLPPLLRRYRVDAVFHTQWQTAAASIRARNAGLVRKVFVAAHIRELLLNPLDRVPVLGRQFERYREWVLRNVDHFYPVSDFTAETLCSMGVESERITVVINGADPDRYFPDRKVSVRKELGLEGKRVLLTVTRLQRRKGIDIVLEAMPRILTQIPDLHYLIVGEGEERERLEKMTADLGLQKHVTFAGGIPRGGLNAYFNAGDLFVMPSRTDPPDVEGFGIVFLEANACGLPVIGSNSGGIPSAIVDGETGYIVPEESPGLLAERIIELLRDPDRMCRLGRQGRERVLREASWKVVSRRLFDDMSVRMKE